MPDEAPASDLLTALNTNLVEFRRRLMFTVAFFLLAVIGAYLLSPYALEELRSSASVEQLIFISPQEGIITRLKLALVGGLLFTAPIILWQLTAIIRKMRPDLKRWKAFLFILVTYILFWGGAAFSYFWVVPAALRFLLGFGGENLEPLITFQNYVSFALTVVIPTGIIFDWPVVVFVLARAGILTSRGLRERRGYAYLLVFAVAAFVTPGPDVFTQLLVAVPIVFLYEVSLLIARIAQPRWAASIAEDSDS